MEEVFLGGRRQCLRRGWRSEVGTFVSWNTRVGLRTDERWICKTTRGRDGGDCIEKDREDIHSSMRQI